MFIGRTDVEAETPICGHLMRRADSFEKTLMLVKIEGREVELEEDTNMSDASIECFQPCLLLGQKNKL